VHHETERIEQFVESGGYKKTGAKVSATFAIEYENGVQILDVELLIPLDKPFTPPCGCVCKPEFKLTNAVSLRCTGGPIKIQEAGVKLHEFIVENKMTPITCGYNVIVQEAKADVENLIVDIFVGISPNIL
jgi:hypothetical protein